MKINHEKNTDPKELYEEYQDKAHKGYQELKDKAANLTEQVKEKVTGAVEEGKQKIHQAEDLLGTYSDDLIKTIKEQPVTSVLIAAGIGFVLSKFFKK